MKRELTAALLLLLLILVSLWNTCYLDRLTDEVNADLERAERAAARGDYDAALTALNTALTVWQNAGHYTNIFLRHPDVDAANDAFYQADQLLLQRDGKAFPAALALLRYHLRCIEYMEHLSVGTVF